MIDTNALRKKVLDLAIRGKLVPQNPNDEPASVLLERIREEKQRLIREGKIKKDKVDSVIFRGDDNCHYEKIGDTVKKIDLELPNGWEFCRLSLVCWLNNGEKSSGEKLPYLDARTLRGKNDKTYLDNGIIVTEGEKVILVDGENSGEVFIVPYRGYMGSTFKILQMVSNINVEFIKIILDYYKDILKESKTGAAIPHLNKQLLKSIIIGVPPIDEQNRIVSQVQQIMQYIDLLENNQNDYANLVETLKKAVLQSAIQGTLVEQDEADEPASILLGRIREEKRKQLGKKYIESYIYKGDDNRYYEHIGDNDIDITEEIPYDLPKNWCFTRLNEYLDVRDGTHDSPKYCESGYPLVTSKNLSNGAIDFSTAKMISEKDYIAINERSFVDNNDILFAMIGSIGNPVLVKKDRDFAIKNMALFKQRTLIQNMEYMLYYSTYIQDSLRRKTSGALQPFISLNFFRNLIIPIPPLAEQERIVSKINEIFAQL